MIAPTKPPLLDQWRRTVGSRRRRRAQPKPLAAMGYLTNGPVIEGLIEIEKLVLVVLYDEPDQHGRPALRLAGFSGACIPWGVRWGGPEQCRFFKNLQLQPRPAAKGQRLDSSSVDLLRLGLQLERELQRHIRYGRRLKRQQVQLPKLWAGFRATDVPEITGEGPELDAYCRRTGKSTQSLLKQFRRGYCGLTLYPLPWMSHHWQQAVAVLADLEHFPRRQVFPLRSLPDDLVGCQGAAECDFYGSRFRRHSYQPQSNMRQTATADVA